MAENPASQIWTTLNNSSSEMFAKRVMDGLIDVFPEYTYRVVKGPVLWRVEILISAAGLRLVSPTNMIPVGAYAHGYHAALLAHCSS